MARETVMVFCAHSDDQIIGLGGTLIKYAKQGKRIITVIFSYGAFSNPWLKKDEIIKIRVKEAQAANKIVKGGKVIFFGLREGHFKEDAKERKVHKKIESLIQKYKPKTIFTHSIDEVLPDHKAVYNILIDSLNKINCNSDVYMFDVWNPFNLRKRNEPKLYVDISKEFKKKIKTLQCFESQWHARATLSWSIYLRDFLNGFRNNTTFSERFYKAK